MIFASECRGAAIGSSPGWSDDELRESSGTPGLRVHQHWRRAIDSQPQPIPPSRNPTNVGRQQRRRSCRLRLGRIERCGDSFARRRASWFFYVPGLRLTRKASLRSPGATSGRRFAARSNEGQHWGIALWGSGREAFAVDGSERGSAESACGLPGPRIPSPSPPPSRGRREPGKCAPEALASWCVPGSHGKCVPGALCGVARDLPIRY